jgi:monoamine oxidase
MAEGNGTLPARIAGSLPDVRLRTHARAIVHRTSGVRVELAVGGSVDADAAVVAVPARIAARLRFEPFLPEELAIAIRELPMGVAAKLAVPLGGEPTRRAVQSTEIPFWSWVADGVDGRARSCLTSFAGSSLALERLDVASGEPTVWLERLRGLHPDLRLADGAVMHDWAGDPLALGAYSAWDNRSWDRMGEFERTVGRLAFAGEHTAGPEHHGTMEGALRSGVRAARQVLETIG